MKTVLRLLFGSLALLPLGVLYVLADIIRFVLYYIVRYRRKMVRANLAACFPDLSEKERRRIERQFYRNFADYMVETVKLLHISDAEMSRRMVFENVELMDRLNSEGRSIVVYFGHIGNWEWAPSVTLHTAAGAHSSVRYAQIYRPLRNKAFDALMLRLRGRFGSVSIPKAMALRTLLSWKRENIVSTTGFMSDQKPSHGDPAVEVNFLGRQTAFISGTETLASKLSMAAIYWDMEKIKRGHYRITCRLLTDNAASVRHGELTRAYAAMLEESILRDPAIWLWSHNRWKRFGTPPASQA